MAGLRLSDRLYRDCPPCDTLCILRQGNQPGLMEVCLCRYCFLRQARTREHSRCVLSASTIPWKAHIGYASTTGHLASIWLSLPVTSGNNFGIVVQSHVYNTITCTHACTRKDHRSDQECNQMVCSGEQEQAAKAACPAQCALMLAANTATCGKASHLVLSVSQVSTARCLACA